MSAMHNTFSVSEMHNCLSLDGLPSGSQVFPILDRWRAKKAALAGPWQSSGVIGSMCSFLSSSSPFTKVQKGQFPAQVFHGSIELLILTENRILTTQWQHFKPPKLFQRASVCLMSLFLSYSEANSIPLSLLAVDLSFGIPAWNSPPNPGGPPPPKLPPPPPLLPPPPLPPPKPLLLPAPAPFGSAEGRKHMKENTGVFHQSQPKEAAKHVSGAG
jgi:hypothetical protein